MCSNNTGGPLPQMIEGIAELQLPLDAAKLQRDVALSPRSTRWFRYDLRAACRSSESRYSISTAATLTWTGTAVGRFCFWPDGLPLEKIISVVSSRLGRKLEHRQAWFRALRAVCRQVAEKNQRLLLVPHTAAAPFLERAAALFGAKTLEIQLPQSVQPPATWWTDMCNGRTAGPIAEVSHLQRRAYLSPPVTSDPQSNPPISDRVSVHLNDQTFALYVRPGGNVSSLLTERLEATGAGQVRIALGDQLTADKTRDALLAAGSIGWYLYEQSNHKEKPARPATSSTPTTKPTHKVLIHCTRRTDGPWPDQSSQSFLDELILASPASDHSALATLSRIVHSRRLLASPKAIRGGTPVVSFTEVPLDELRRLCVFRPHRGRWDFQPYGIAIRRDRLKAIGTRPIRYVAKDEWETVSREDQPYCQVNHSLTKSGAVIDWTVEQEWRHVGDIDLSALPDDVVYVFVPTAAEAAELQGSCPWPVVAVEAIQE